jgi:glycosyltransferase involved in cell wall biosynthesis
MNPLVSIIIPTYNRAHLIGETLDSILAQTYKNWECIIVDDGSIDNTKETINLYLIEDSRFRYYQRPIDRPKGGNSCRNYGFELSKGSYVKWFDSDDIMYVNFLEVQMRILKNDTNLDFCACQWEYFYKNNSNTKKNYINLKIQNHPLFSYFLEAHVFITHSPMWKRSFLEGKELFDLKLFRSQEADFHFRMLVFSPNYLLHEDFLFKVRRGHESIESSASSSTARLSVLHYFQKAFYITLKLDFPLKEKVLQYLVFRNARQVYVLLIKEKSFLKRIKYLYYYKEILYFYNIIGFINASRMIFGFTILLFFRKGYDLMNLKSYDYRKSLKKKILIIGPIGDFGGRELMTGFIAESIDSKFKAKVCTTGFLTSESQVYQFNPNLKVISLKKEAIKRNLIIKILAYISFIKNRKKKNILEYANNLWAKKYFGYENKIEKIIVDLIKDFDLILINGQLSSKHSEFIIQKSVEFNKKIVFRTTGTIQPNQNFDYLNQVDLFIHHSESNACRLQIKNHKYVTIDQCAFNEEELLKIPLVNSRVKNFLVIGRFEKEKNIDIVIESFLRVKSEGDLLYVIGDGAEVNNLTKIANNNESIVFPGFVSNNNLKEFFLKVDCVIISSNEESGPLVGIESMAAGKLLLSTKVGAMPERLKDIKTFWFDKSVESLIQQIIKVKEMDKREVLLLSNNIKERYRHEYSKNKIASKYLEIIDSLTRQCE